MSHKRIKIIIWLFFPTIIFLAGFSFWLYTCVKENANRDLSIYKKEIWKIEKQIDSLQNLRLNLPIFSIVDFEPETVRKSLLKHSKEILFFQMDSVSLNGRIQGEFNELIFLLSELSNFAPQIILYSFQMQKLSSIWQLDFSLGPLLPKMEIIQASLISLDSLEKRWQFPKVQKFILNRERQKEKVLHTNKLQEKCMKQSFKILGVVAGYSCLIETLTGKEMILQGESFNGYRVDSVFNHSVLFRCGDKTWLKEVGK